MTRQYSKRRRAARLTGFLEYVPKWRKIDFNIPFARPADHPHNIVEAGNDSWRFKSRDDDHAAPRSSPATPASSDKPSATASA